MAEREQQSEIARSMNSEKKVALVAGAMGVIGRSLVQLLSKPEKDEEWTEVIAVSRRPLDFVVPYHVRHLAIDLLDVENVNKHLESLEKVTHIFFAAYQEKPTLAEQVPPNIAMLRNLVSVVSNAPNSRLKHVSLAEGTKWYGCHLGPLKTPAKETDPRALPPNFYYDQEDYLRQEAEASNGRWTWSGVRPNPVCGWAYGNPMNLVSAIGVYGAICNELNIPMRFPGSEAAFRILLEVVDVELLAKVMVWAATHPNGANQAFNVSNGDLFRWRNVWPAIAKFFGTKDTEFPLTMTLASLMSDKEDLWKEMQRKYGLVNIPFKDLVAWSFADWVFSREYDWFSDVNKLRRAGFHDQVLDSEEMFLRQLQQLRDNKIIP
eukprot:TRINITY_DN7004_c0_g1_i1.p1 TRINITY_DN7004_c0_g1~~TRINITY_DN7004_c0_g1_i1.p1  ORF type:complete len:409 (-),score=75.46 TRINITY_DN7004_c0_g1_i1:178-1308(-)